MFKDNLIALRKMKGLSQEELAGIINVSRQTLSKYETGESLPDVEKCKQIADVFEVSLDDLVNYESKDTGLGVPPKGKHMFGMVKVGDKEELGLIQIYTPNGKQNLISYLVGTSDNGINKLKLYKFSLVP